MGSIQTTIQSVIIANTLKIEKRCIKMLQKHLDTAFLILFQAKPIVNDEYDVAELNGLFSQKEIVK